MAPETYGPRHNERVKRLGARRAFSSIGLIHRDRDAVHFHWVSLTSRSRTAVRTWFDTSKLTLTRTAGLFGLKDDNAGG